MRQILAYSLALGMLVAAAAGAQEAEPARERVVIPFDFESTFDDGRYGKMVGDMIWKKLDRRGGFVIPESMLDVRAWCQRKKMTPNPKTPRDEMKRLVRDEFGGEIGIWGKVERVEGFSSDVYDLWIYVVDFSHEPPRTIYETKARTKTVSEIPHVYVREALDKLYGNGERVAQSKDADAEYRWKTAENLVAGDFEQGNSSPVGWDPLPKYVRWIRESSKTDGKKNRFIRFSFPASVAATSGVLYYSDYFPVEEGATYRFQCRWRTTGSSVKVFIKCYDEIPTRFRKTDQSQRGAYEKREVYRSQQNLKGEPGQWNVHTEDFTPKHTHYTPQWGRVMLYAYHPAGTVDWDDIIVKQIKPAPKGRQKERRPSLETKVRSEDLPRSK